MSTTDTLNVEELAKKLEEEEARLAKVPDQFMRTKGASWFFPIQEQLVLVLGQGGIGSWLTLLLARAGCQRIITYDGDVFEKHNLTGQLVGDDAIGTNKAIAIQSLVSQLSPATKVYASPQMFDENEGISEVIMCGFDNMKARKLAFTKWKEELLDVPQEMRHFWFFQDGRLLSEQLQIFNIPGNRPDLIERYEKEYLFDDAEVEEASCTFKQTSHSAAMIASQMIGFYTNFISSAHKGEFRKLPFMYEYIIPLNRATKIE